MGKLLRLTALIALLNLIWIGYSYAREYKPFEPDKCPSIPFAEGRVFEIRQDGLPPSYIFGTMHSKNPEVLKLPTPAAVAIMNVDHVATETSTSQAQKMKALEMMILPEDKDLFNLAGRERTTAIQEAAARYGLPDQFIRRLKPWAFASLLSMTPEELQDQQTPVLDEKIENIANMNGKQHHALETMEYQLGLFDALSLNEQFEYLDLSLLDPSILKAYRTQMREIYLDSKIGTLHCIIEQASSMGSARLRSFILDDLLTKRNHSMSKSIAKLLRNGVFVAIGAGHLPGEEGVLNLLKKQGYQVQPLANVPTLK